MTKAIDDFSDDVLGVDGGIFGINAAEQSRDDQNAGMERARTDLAGAKTELQTAQDQARQLLQPFMDFGQGQLGNLNNALSNNLNTREGQQAFLQGNPFIEHSLNNANQATMGNRAARGKLGSGGTLDALRSNALATALPIYQTQMGANQQNVNNLFNAVGLGANTANGMANNEMSGANARAALTQGQAGIAQGIGNNNGLYQVMQNNAGRGLSNAILGPMFEGFTGAEGLNLGGMGSQFGADLPGMMSQGGNALMGGASAAGSGLMSGASAAGGGLMSMLSQAAPAFLTTLSDVRLKDNIKRVGSTDSGLPVYTYTYKGSNVTQMGVMAQDVEQVYPDAVVTVNGFKAVNYGAI